MKLLKQLSDAVKMPHCALLKDTDFYFNNVLVLYEYEESY